MNLSVILGYEIKMIERAAECEINLDSLTQRFLRYFLKDHSNSCGREMIASDMSLSLPYSLSSCQPTQSERNEPNYDIQPFLEHG